MKSIKLFIMITSFFILGTSVLPLSLYAEETDKPSKQKAIVVPKPPELSEISDKDLEALIDKANKGDEMAQNEVAKRYHWANFSDPLLKKVDIANWQNMDERAKNDYQMAYLLISRNQMKKHQEVIETLLNKAKSGDPAFQNLLGNLYSQSGISEGKWDAFDWHRKSAAQGFAPGELNLACNYEEGRGVAKDYKKAFDLYQKSANQGYSVAEFRLGNMYFDGRGVTENMAQALEYFEKSAKKSYPQAKDYLSIYKDGGWDPKNPPKSSLELTQKAAEKGNMFAQKILGKRYFEAIGVNKDEQKAISWWEKAANQGDPEAQLRLFFTYMEGPTKREDFDKAASYLQKAVDSGDTDALVYKAFILIRDGNEADKRMGIKTLQEEAEKGSILAEYFLERIASRN